jgi:phosphoglycolate phosphatase
MVNKKIKHVTFDLDGTLVNSGSTIYKTTLKALNVLNINAVIKEKEFNRMIGAHFINIFNELKIVVKDVNQFIDIYKGFYFDFIDDSEFYPGVLDTLKYLKEKNILISLLTTKNQDQARKIIEYFDVQYYFNFIMGRRDGIGYKPSAEPLLFICKELGVKPEETLIVGDTELDIMCGKNANAATCAVTYGYRTKEKLEEQMPDYIISGLPELKKII